MKSSNEFNVDPATLDHVENIKQRNISYTSDASSPSTGDVEKVLESSGPLMKYPVIKQRKAEYITRERAILNSSQENAIKSTNTASEEYENWMEENGQQFKEVKISSGTPESTVVRNGRKLSLIDPGESNKRREEKQQSRISEWENSSGSSGCCKNVSQSGVFQPPDELKKTNRMQYTSDVYRKVPVPKPRSFRHTISHKFQREEEKVANIVNEVHKTNSFLDHDSSLSVGIQLAVGVNSWENEPKCCLNGNEGENGIKPEYIQQTVDFEKGNRVRKTVNPFETTDRKVPMPKPRKHVRNTIQISGHSKPQFDQETAAKFVNKIHGLNSIPDRNKSFHCARCSMEKLFLKRGENRLEKKTNPKRPEERKSDSIVENYRQSLREQIHQELEQMRRDGSFVDLFPTNENTFLRPNLSREENGGTPVSTPIRGTTYSSTNSCTTHEFDGYVGINTMISNHVAINRGDFHHENQENQTRENFGEVEAETASPNIHEDSTIMASSKKLAYIVDEIKSTERNYIDDLIKIVRDFIPYILMCPVELLELQVVDNLFRCIRDILRNHMDFLRQIENFQDIDSIIETLIENKSLLSMYPKYFRIKPKTDDLLKEFSSIFEDMQMTFGDQCDFSTYLLFPILRLGKYVLFLRKVEEEQKRLNKSTEQTQVAIEMVRAEMCKGNTYVAIDSIKNSSLDEHYHNYGSFIMREQFNKSKHMVFLFEKVIVFTAIDQNNPETFYHYGSIKMEDLRIATFENFIIHLTDYTNSKKNHKSQRYTYVLEAKTEKVWNFWRETIENILWQQLYKVKEMTIKAGSLKRSNTSICKNRNKSAGSSIFYTELEK